MSGKKKKAEAVSKNINKKEDSIVSAEESAIDAALSASLDGFYENDFEHSQDEYDDLKNIPEHIAEDFDDDIVDLTKNNEFTEDGAETLRFTRDDVIREEETPEFTEEDDALIADISDALSVQINTDFKKQKKKNRMSFWWLLTLLPVIGIIVLFIKRIRKDMPKILMVLRVLVFFAFAVFILGTVMTEGRLFYMATAKYSEMRMQYVPEEKEFMPSPTPRILKEDEKDNYFNVLVTIKGDDKENDIQIFVSYDEILGRLSFYNIVQPLENDFKTIKREFENTYMAKLDAVYETEKKGFIKFINRMKGIELSLSQTEADLLKKAKVKGYKKITAGECVLKGEAVYAYMQLTNMTLEHAEGLLAANERQLYVLQSIVNRFSKGFNLNSGFAVNYILKKTKTDAGYDFLYDFFLSADKNKLRNFAYDLLDNRDKNFNLRSIIYGETD